MPRRARSAQLVAAALMAAFAVAACDSDDAAAPTDVVGAADAITAVVAWQADEQQPVLDDNGEELLPVIFIVADISSAIDVGVQADVAAATADWATVRFADDVADTFTPDLEGEPVRDDGVMLLVGPMPDPAQSVEVALVRYRSVHDAESFTLEITDDPTTTDTDNSTPNASVTSVTQP